MTKEKKGIYDLGLHESTILPCGICIMRVAGGWIYDCWDTSKDEGKQGTFVPFHKEFKGKEK